MIFLDQATNKRDFLRVAKNLGEKEVIYTHFTKINFSDYENLKYVICPCTDISHLGPVPEGTTCIYLMDKLKLFEKVVSSAEWVVHNLFRLLKHNPEEQDELRGKSIGFVGFGRMMQRVAKMLSCCEVEMYYYDKKEPEFYSTGVEKCRFADNIFATCDIVIVGLSLNNSTANFVGSYQFKLMSEKRAYFINNSRSAIVDGKALLGALKENWLRGCALDVTESYDYDLKKALFDFVYKKRNAIITPHIAGKGVQSRINTDKIVLGVFKEVLSE
jgi:phosphoglycerate dehydrogenase-like enzyme